jgi:hypothetical protein
MAREVQLQSLLATFKMRWDKSNTSVTTKGMNAVKKVFDKFSKAVLKTPVDAEKKWVKFTFGLIRGLSTADKTARGLTKTLAGVAKAGYGGAKKVAGNAANINSMMSMVTGAVDNVANGSLNAYAAAREAYYSGKIWSTNSTRDNAGQVENLAIQLAARRSGIEHTDLLTLASGALSSASDATSIAAQMGVRETDSPNAALRKIFDGIDKIDDDRRRKHYMRELGFTEEMINGDVGQRGGGAKLREAYNTIVEETKTINPLSKAERDAAENFYAKRAILDAQYDNEDARRLTDNTVVEREDGTKTTQGEINQENMLQIYQAQKEVKKVGSEIILGLMEAVKRITGMDNIAGAAKSMGDRVSKVLESVLEFANDPAGFLHKTIVVPIVAALAINNPFGKYKNWEHGAVVDVMRAEYDNKRSKVNK